MKTIIRFQAIIGALTLMAFSPQAIIPVQAMTARQVALLAWTPGVDAYTKADTAYNLHGAKAFLKALPKGTLTKKDESFVREQLKQRPTMPKVVATETGFRMTLEGRSVDVTVVDAKTGHLRIGSQDFIYDRAGGLEKNARLAQALANQIRQPAEVSVVDWLVPSAHAEINWGLVIGIGVAVLGAVLLTWYLTKKNRDKKIDELTTENAALKAEKGDIQVDEANTTPSSAEPTVVEHSDTPVE